MKQFKYNTKHNLKTTLEMGEITPIYWETFFPNESIKNLNFRNITRMITPIYPTMDNPYIDIYTFKIPYRLINLADPSNYEKTPNIKMEGQNIILTGQESVLKDKNFKAIKVMFGMSKQKDLRQHDLYQKLYDPENPKNSTATLDTGNNDFGDKPEYGKNKGTAQYEYNSQNQPQSPEQNIYDSKIIEFFWSQNALGKLQLFKKFGITAKKLETLLENKQAINLNYILAYHKIYESFFKQKQLENFTYKKLWDLLFSEGDVGDNTKQKPILNTGLSQTEREINNSLIDLKGSVVDIDSTILFNYAPKATALQLLNTIWIGNTDNNFLENLTFKPIEADIDNNIENKNQEHFWNKAKQWFSKMFSDNKAIMTKIENGTDKDYLINIWNANNNDKTQPQLIGYKRINQSIQQVTTTANTQTTSGQNFVGDVGGQSITYNQGNLLSSEQTFNEKTIILSVAVPNYHATLSNFIDPLEWDANIEDFEPEKETYVQQTIEMPWIYEGEKLNYSSTSNIAVAYTIPYNNLREKQNVVAGDMIDNFNNWIYGRNDEREIIDTKLLKIDKIPFKKTLTTGDAVEPFLCEFEFSATNMRVIKPVGYIENKILKGE